MAQWALMRAGWTLPLTNGRKRTETRELSSRILFPPSERGQSAPVPSNLYANRAGVDIMYYPDAGWRHQALVYFGNNAGTACCCGGARRRGGISKLQYF